MRSRLLFTSLVSTSCGPATAPEEDCGSRVEGWDQEIELETSHQWARAEGIAVSAGQTVVLANIEVEPGTARRFVNGLDSEREVVWQHEGPDDEIGRAFAAAPDGGVLVCDELQVHQHHRVTRFASDGEVLWSTTGAEDCGGIDITSSGVVVVGGTTEISRFDADGRLLPSWPIDLPDGIRGVAADGDALAVLGYRSAAKDWVGRVDESGEMLWIRDIGATEVPTAAITIAVDFSGDVIVGGYVGVVNGGPTGVPVPPGLWRLSSDGDLRWAIEGGFADGSSGRINDLVVGPDGQVMVTGSVSSMGPGLLVAEVADDGEIMWWEAKRAETNHAGFGIAMDSCGGVHVAGQRFPNAWVGRYTRGGS